MVNRLNRSVQAILGLPREVKRLVALVIDASLCVLTVWLAYYLRLGEFVPLRGMVLWCALASVAMALPIFVISGFYRAIFRYAGWQAFVAVTKATAVYGIIFAALFTVLGVPGVPRTVGLIQPMLLLLAVGGTRALGRFWLGGGYRQQLRQSGLPQVLIYGAGAAGQQLAAAIINGRELKLRGFLDDSISLQGNAINGLRVYGVQELPRLVESLGITDVLLAIPSASRKRRNEILSDIRRARVSVRTLPGMMELVQGRVNVEDLRELDIDDLLGREAVEPNPDLLGRNIAGKTVLVTGAGGSIGSELCRQIIGLRPKTLLLLEQGEFALYAIHQELQERGGAGMPRLVPLLASVCDEDRLMAIMQTWKPDTVYHAAAYKHVPLVEHNPVEGVRNNVVGTWTAARSAAANGVADFVLISTDKAVRPTNVMGASKRLAEMVLQALAAQNPSTRFSMVRFGNVLGSSGSVVPKFRQQIRDGGPLTLTHAEITRYFMTIPEAAQLVIQAGAMAGGGDVFVLDMGEPVRIIDLARRLIELSGLSVKDDAHPEGDIEIAITGLRPGEKLYEELLIGDNPRPTAHARIMKAHEDFLPWGELDALLTVLLRALQASDVETVRQLLRQLVSGYTPSGDIVDWVYLEQSTEPTTSGGGTHASV